MLRVPEKDAEVDLGSGDGRFVIRAARFERAPAERVQQLLLGGALDRTVGVVALALRGIAQHVVRALDGREGGRVAALVGVLLCGV